MRDDRPATPSSTSGERTARRPRTPSLERVCEALSQRGCRVVLSLLRDVPALSEAELATGVARERAGGADAVSERDRRAALVDLRHDHLPRLSDAGVIERNPVERTVALQHRSILEQSGVFRWLDRPRLDFSGDAMSVALRDSRRRTAVSVLDEAGRPLSLSDLAAGVAAREGTPGDDVAVADVIASLHHVHLPKLVEFGMVDYDPGRRRVAFLGAPYR